MATIESPFALFVLRAPTKKPPFGGFFVLLADSAPGTNGGQLSVEDNHPGCLPEESQAAAVARALTLADRRLLSRAALFLWKMPLSAIVSSTD